MFSFIKIKKVIEGENTNDGYRGADIKKTEANKLRFFGAGDWRQFELRAT
jgi:hypothetical protein